VNRHGGHDLQEPPEDLRNDFVTQDTSERRNMLHQDRLRAWMMISVVILSTAAVPLARRLRNQPVACPRTLTHLTEMLSQQAPSLHVVSMREDDLESGIYVCMQSQPREKLLWLRRTSEGASKWQGVVYCERVGTEAVIEEHEIETWDKHGMQIGPFLFFGDPDLLLDICTLLRADKNRQSSGSHRSRAQRSTQRALVFPPVQRARISPFFDRQASIHRNTSEAFASILCACVQ
jgi:hypothetical protein